MTRYSELSAALAQAMPHWQQADRTIRSVPTGMKKALKKTLDAPQGTSAFFSAMYGVAVGYVHFVRPEDGLVGPTRKFQHVDDHLALSKSVDGMLHFHLAVILDPPEGGLPNILYLEFSLEDVGSEEIKLFVKNRNGALIVRPREENGFDAAAITLIDWMIESLQDPASGLDRNSRIGFLAERDQSH